MLSSKDMLAAAQQVVTKIDPAQAKEMVDQGALLLDIRDGTELATTGRAVGALHVSRGMLEFKADPENTYYDEAFQRDRPIVLFCASGGRAWLAGKTLHDMGYAQVFNLGGFKDWKDAGLPVEPA